MSMILVAFVVCVLHLPVILGAPTGAPRIACNDMTPQHGVPPQTGPSPFDLTVEKDEATNRFHVTIEKTSADGPAFRGFLVQARDQATSAKVGQFYDPVAGSQLLNCDSVGDSITHTINNDKTSFQLNWIPPPGSLSGIKFTLSVVQQVDTFWTFVLSDDLGGF